MKPALRKPIGILALILGLCLYAGLAVTVAGLVDHWHMLLQLPVYLLLGIVWVLPLKPWVRFMETGSWTRRDAR